MMLHTKLFHTILLSILITIIVVEGEWSLVNLDEKCMYCLCDAATGCDKARQCIDNFCGPYRISKEYWFDADNLTMYLDDYRRFGAFEACANDYYCARRIVVKYLSKYAFDTNDDGVTDCYDYLMLNFNGRHHSKQSMENNANAAIWLQRYTKCMKL